MQYFRQNKKLWNLRQEYESWFWYRSLYVIWVNFINTFEPQLSSHICTIRETLLSLGNKMNTWFCEIPSKVSEESEFKSRAKAMQGFSGDLVKSYEWDVYSRVRHTVGTQVGSSLLSGALRLLCSCSPQLGLIPSVKLEGCTWNLCLFLAGSLLLGVTTPSFCLCF